MPTLLSFSLGTKEADGAEMEEQGTAAQSKVSSRWGQLGGSNFHMSHFLEIDNLPMF